MLIIGKTCSSATSRHSAALISLIAATPLSALAQDGRLPHPPDVSTIDANGVELPSMLATISLPAVAIGGAGGLSATVGNRPDGGVDLDGAPTGEPIAPSRYYRSGFYPKRPFDLNYIGTIECTGYNPATIVVKFNGVSERFLMAGSTSVPGMCAVGASVSKRGGTLVWNGDTTYTYTGRDGTQYVADYRFGGIGIGGPVITSVVYPTGERLTITFKASGDRRRLSSVVSSRGWMLKYLYDANGDWSTVNSTEWLRVARIVAINLASEYCDASADTCGVSQVWPDAAVTWSPDYRSLSIRNQQGGTTVFGLTQYYEIASITPPGHTAPSITYGYCSRGQGPGPNCTNISGTMASFTVQTFFGLVYSTSQYGTTTTYGFLNGIGGYTNFSKSDNPVLGSMTVYTNAAPHEPINRGALQSVGISQRGTRLGVGYSGVADNRIMSASAPGAGSKSYTYDERGNVLTETETAKDGSGQTLVTTLGYEAGCANRLTCNKPLWRRDSKNYQTDYTYDLNHGVLTETGPAVGGVRPQTRYTYVQRRAWVKNVAGAYVASPYIWVLSSTSICRSSTATGTIPGPCVTSGDEVRTTYEYGPDSGPNNLLVRGVLLAANGKSRRTCFRYDRFGNKISETTPAAGVTTCS